MPDQRSVMKEFRSLERKRAAEGLSRAEEARLAELRELVGPEAGAGGLKGGFDVSAAAARLRDSLVPAGTRTRPPPPEPKAETAASPAPELSAANALASTYAVDPFAPVEAGGADALLDASTLDPYVPPADDGALATEWDAGAAYDPASQAYADAAPGEDAAQAWQPPEAFPPADAAAQPPYGAEEGAAAAGPEAAPGWDPAQPFDPNAPYDAGAEAGQEPDGGYDPNAAAAWDPAQPFDPNAPPTWDASAIDPNAAAAYDPNVAGYDPNAAAYDPAAAAAYDPNAPGGYDLGAAAGYDPNAAPAWDPGAPPPWSPDAPLDPSAAPAWDANAVDPGAAGYDPSAAGYDPNAPTYDADVAASYDPNAAPAWDPNAPLERDPGLAPQGDAALDAFATAAGGAAPVEGDAAAWDPFPPAAPEPAAFDAAALFGEPEPGEPAAPLHVDPGALSPEGWDLSAPRPEAPPANAPLGEYDETASPALPPGEDAGLESMLPLDAGIEAAAEPEPYGAPRLGEYDDTAGFSGAAFPDVAPADLPAEGGGFEAARAIAPGASEGWHPEPAVDEGFLLESGGSFDAAAAAAAPEWAIGGDAALPWESAAPDDATAPAGPPPAQESAAPADAQPAPGAEMASVEPDAIEPAPPPPAGAAGDAAPTAADADLPSFDVDVDEEAVLAAPEPEPAPDAAIPERASAAEVAPADGDLAAESDAPVPELSGPLPALDFSRPDLSEGRPEDDFTVPQAAALPPPEDDIPTIDGEEILDEVPAEDGAAPAPSLDFEPLVAPASQGNAPEPARSQPAAIAPPSPPVVAPPLPPTAAAPIAPPAPPAPRTAPVERLVPGSHRVVIHTVEGQVKRGVLEDADLAAASLGLSAQAGAAPDLVGVEKVKAIFFMLAPGEKPPAAEGKKVRVTFRDGRQIAGFSPEYDETGPGFFMVPADTRTNTGRIWVYRAAVKQVAVS